MESGDELKELHLTGDEMDRLSKAFKDETFMGMLRDYTQELSDPENKRRYEEEIKIMEREKGDAIEFIHPEPFRALRTSVNGERKCFINICANEKVGKPVCEGGVSEEGRGQRWSLPHNLHPGRQERDPKGREVTIYDVIFHPHTLYIASKNKAFMAVVESTAFEGIQKAFSVSLDQTNAREMKSKYKGTPRPCVVRKPIPGYKSEEHPGGLHPPLFPHPDGKRPTPSSVSGAAESPVMRSSSSSSRHADTRGPTEPNHAVKYRSFVDLQDFRCSRDSAQSPRPKEIVVTIDLPLLKAARDASLEVEEKRLLLESGTPAYRLELPLAYPVDGDRGEATFSTQRRRLTVTLPVLPSREAREFAVGLVKTSPRGDERQEEERREVEKEDTWEGEERGGPRGEGQRGDDEGGKGEDGGDVEEEQTRAERGEGEGGSGQERGEGQGSEGENRGVREEVGGGEAAKWKQTGKGQGSVEEVEDVDTQKRRHRDDSGGREDNESAEDGERRAAGEEESSATGGECEGEGKPCEEITAELSGRGGRGGEVNPIGLESKAKTSDNNEATGETLKLGGVFLHDVPADTQSQNIQESSSQVPEADEAKESGGGGSDDGGNGVPRSSGGVATASANPEEGENVDEDDLPTAQLFQSPGRADEPPLREIDERGNEKILGDHSTSAGFVFLNSLMYELD